MFLGFIYYKTYVWRLNRQNVYFQFCRANCVWLKTNNTFLIFLLLAGPAWNKPIARTQYVPIRQISGKYIYVVSPTHKTINN